MAQGTGLPSWIDFDNDQQYAVDAFAMKHQHLVKSRRLEPCLVCRDTKQHHNNLPVGNTMKCKGSFPVWAPSPDGTGKQTGSIPCTNAERLVVAVSFKPMNATEQAELDELRNKAASDYSCDVANYDAETGYARHDLG